MPAPDSETSALWQQSLVDVVSAARTGVYSSEQYTRACLARIEALEPRVQAWAWLDAETAVAKARAADSAAARGEARPLQGIPLGIKDIIDTAGIPTRMGTPVYAENIPRESATVVQRLENAGGFIMGKTVTAELAYYSPGPTCNPWNPAHTPGGSSSGSAAAVAAGFVPVALGTQTNGSVIRPAAYCGCIGFKPSASLIPRTGILSFSPTLDQVGLFTRSIDDAALLLSVLDGVAIVKPVVHAPRLIAVRTPAWECAEAHAQAHFASVVNALRVAGASVEERELPRAFAGGHAIHKTIMYAEGARSFARLQDTHRDQLSAAINALIDEGRAISENDLRTALAARDELCAQLPKFLGEADAIITPPAAGAAPATLSSTGDPAFCTLWTLCGVPALTFPSGRAPGSLPLGTQIVGAPRDDARVLAVAQWCRQALGYRAEFPAV